MRQQLSHPARGMCGQPLQNILQLEAHDRSKPVLAAVVRIYSQALRQERLKGGNFYEFPNQVDE